MIGSILTRGLTLMLGYLYPAYECFKSVEKNRPEMEHLRFWCEYWVIIALVTVLERVGGDAIISWLPLYGEAKLAFIVYLWYPQTRGTTYVYATFVRPFVAKYEEEIDGNLGDLKTRAGDIAYFYGQRSSAFFQSRFVELVQFLASQSPTAPYAAPAPRPPPQQTQDLYPPRPPPPRLQSGGGSGGLQQSSAPAQPPPGYPGGGGNQQGTHVYPSGGSAPYPSAPLRSGNSGGSNQWQGGAQPPAPVYPPPRSRSVEDEEFEMVDQNNTDPSAPPYMPEETSGPNGYHTRSRQRALGDRARRSGGSGNLYYAGGGG